MTLIPSTAASAVYHDALTTARGWRNLCFIVLFLILAGQLALFLTARFTEGVIPVRGDEAEMGQAEIPTGVDIDQTTRPVIDEDGEIETDRDIDADVTTSRFEAGDVQTWLYFVLYACLWCGLVFSILMSVILLVTTLVMLNGRTVGVSRQISGFFWSLVLILLLIPWQGILNHPPIGGGPFHVPGVLYTWHELYENGNEFYKRPDWLGWVRFVVWPAVALLVLLVAQAKARRGVKEALGEDLGLSEEPLRDRPLT